MDAIAVQYARELARWGIETSIVVPGAFTSGTNHFAHAGRPPTRRCSPPTRPAPTPASGTRSRAPSRPSSLPRARRSGPGRRRRRFAVLDRLRAEMLRRVGMADLLKRAVP
jgi:hypothetical protein